MQKIEAPFIEGFIRINRFFQQHHLRHCLIGGIAAGYWGEPRYTRDMDFTVVLPVGGLDALEKLLKKEAFQLETMGTSQLRVVHKEKTFSWTADLLISETDYQDWVVQRAIEVVLFKTKVSICSPEDLIILKLIANRRQDLLDIENVLKNRWAQLDTDYLKEWFKRWELTPLFQREFKKTFPEISVKLQNKNQAMRSS